MKNNFSEKNTIQQLKDKVDALSETVSMLKKSEQLLANAINDAPIGMLTLTVTGKFKTANMAFCQSTGYNEKELLTLNISQITHPDDKHIGNKVIEELISGKARKANFEKRYIHKKGNTIYAQVSTVILKDEIGSPHLFFTQVIDVTERKQMEENLKKYKVILDNSSDLAYTCDTEGNVTFVNKVFTKLSGYKPEDFIGKSFAPLFDKENLEIAVDLYSRTLKGESSTREIAFKKTGKLCEYNTMPLKDVHGKLLGVIGVARDITTRKQKNRLQSVVYQISNATQSTKDLDELYESIHKLLIEVLDVTNFYIAHYDNKEKLLSFPFYRDTKDEFPVGSWPLGRGLTEYIIKTGKSLLLTKKEIEGYEKKGEIDVIGTMPELWMGAPLITENRVIGVIALNSYQNPNLYTKSDLKILTYVAEQIAKTIEYKQAEEKLKSRNKELEVWYDVAVERELTLLDLKKEINELLEKSDEKPKYKILV